MKNNHSLLKLMIILFINVLTKSKIGILKQSSVTSSYLAEAASNSHSK